MIFSRSEFTEIFSVFLNEKNNYESSTSHPGGNKVDGLPPAPSNSAGRKNAISTRNNILGKLAKK